MARSRRWIWAARRITRPRGLATGRPLRRRAVRVTWKQRQSAAGPGYNVPPPRVARPAVGRFDRAAGRVPCPARPNPDPPVAHVGRLRTVSTAALLHRPSSPTSRSSDRPSMSIPTTSAAGSGGQVGDGSWLAAGAGGIGLRPQTSGARARWRPSPMSIGGRSSAPTWPGESGRGEHPQTSRRGSRCIPRPIHSKPRSIDTGSVRVEGRADFLRRAPRGRGCRNAMGRVQSTSSADNRAVQPLGPQRCLSLARQRGYAPRSTRQILEACSSRESRWSIDTCRLPRRPRQARRADRGAGEEAATTSTAELRMIDW
jgi:hypothetical protein